MIEGLLNMAAGVVRRLAMNNRLSDTGAHEALQLFGNAVWQLRRSASGYDAAYIALAEALDAPLLTCDSALGSIPGHRATVLVC